MNTQKLTDEDGFLINPDDWTKEFAIANAKTMGINLTSDHWLIINLIREQYEKTMRVPELRHILKFIKENFDEKKATRKFVYKLFPYSGPNFDTQLSREEALNSLKNLNTRLLNLQKINKSLDTFIKESNQLNWEDLQKINIEITNED